MNDIIWKSFELGEVFKISATKSGIDKNKIIEKRGNIPYITRTDLNNGIGGYIGKKQLDIYKQNSGNVITIGLDTQTVHYQYISFFTGQNIQILEQKNLNEKNAKFLIPLIKVLMNKFNWGSNGATLTRLKRSKILLPTKSDESIDWEYMEFYIEKQECEGKEKTLLFLKEELRKVSNFREMSLADAIWKQFTLGDLFIFQTGKSKGLNHLEKGNIQYLGATKRNNGVLQKNNKLIFVEDSGNLVQKGNGIAFIRNGEGSMGYSVYKSSEFIATSDITIGYNNHLNEFTGLFISRVTDQARGKYSFNYKRSDTRLKKEKIMLPAIDEGTPDYAFMENYIKGIKYNRIIKAIKFLED